MEIILQVWLYFSYKQILENEKNIFWKIFYFKTNWAKLQKHSFEISIVTYKLNVSKYPHFIIYEQYLSYVRD